MSKVWIGTSGWTYDGWRGPFYPPDVAKAEWLCWYALQFPTTEINGSFYRTPSLKAVAVWRDQTPKDFLFAWKASKFITHWKRLSENCANSIELMETRLKVSSPKVGGRAAADDDSVYISLRCPACARVHLVNRAGRTLLPPRP